MTNIISWLLDTFGGRTFLWTSVGLFAAVLALGASTYYYQNKAENIGLKLDAVLLKNKELADGARQAEIVVKALQGQVTSCEGELTIAQKKAVARETIITNAKTVPTKPKQAAKEVLDDASSDSVIEHIDSAFSRLRD